MLNYVRVPLMDERFWAERFQLIGEDRLRAAYARGKGVIFLGAHFGAWDFSAGRVGTSGYPVRIVAKRLSNAVMDKLIVDARAGMNFGTIAHRDSMDRILESLARGEAVGMTIDQNMKRGQGVFVEWLGHLASTVRSVAWVARETGAPVLASWAYPTGPGTFAAEILEEVSWETHPDPEDELVLNTRRLLMPFERAIREHPHLYHWIHRRYKRQPDGVANPYAIAGV
ncbi:MAG: lysophospholipid acyltransferase family protein [Deltaproteobacteria bacterium]|nr:lysophospholipid acyltransferase family protein [Deltaproteobacteria bacterium]